MLSILLLLANGHALASIQPEPAATPVVDAVRSDQARQDAIMKDLRSIPPKRAALGDAEHREGLVKTETWLIDRLASLSIVPRTQEFVWASPALKAIVIPKDAAPDSAPPASDVGKDDPRFTFRNYIVDLPGADLASEVLILAAHYDAVPNSPGADDNASGVAALIDIARALQPKKHRRTIRLVFFTLEEVGLVGSMEYVKSHAAVWKPTPAPQSSAPEAKPAPAKEKVVGMVSLECIGFFSDQEASQTSPVPKIGGKPVLDLEVPGVGNFLGVGGILRHRKFSQAFVDGMKRAEPDLPIVSADSLPFAPPDFLRSDHAPFLGAGLPAIILTDTANFRNPNYHKATDTPDTIDLVRLSRAASAVAAAASELAEPVR